MSSARLVVATDASRRCEPHPNVVVRRTCRLYLRQSRAMLNIIIAASATTVSGSKATGGIVRRGSPRAHLRASTGLLSSTVLLPSAGRIGADISQGPLADQGYSRTRLCLVAFGATPSRASQTRLRCRLLKCDESATTCTASPEAVVQREVDRLFVRVPQNITPGTCDQNRAYSAYIKGVQSLRRS